MDREVVLRPYKIYDWLLNSSRDHFGSTKEKSESDYGVQGLQKTYFKASIIH